MSSAEASNDCASRLPLVDVVVPPVPTAPPGSLDVVLAITPWFDVRKPCRPDFVPPKIDPNACDPLRAWLPVPLALLPLLFVESFRADRLLVELLPPIIDLDLPPKMCRIGAMPQLLLPPPPLLLPVGDGASAGLTCARPFKGLGRPPLPPLLPFGELMAGSASEGKLPVE